MRMPKVLRDTFSRFRKRRSVDSILLGEDHPSYETPLRHTPSYNKAPIQTGPAPIVYMSGLPADYIPSAGPMEVPDQTYRQYDDSIYPWQSNNEFQLAAMEVAAVEPPQKVRYEDGLMTQELFEEQMANLRDSTQLSQTMPFNHSETDSIFDVMASHIPVTGGPYGQDVFEAAIGPDYMEKQMQMFDRQFDPPAQFDAWAQADALFDRQEAVFGSAAEPMSLEQIVINESVDYSNGQDFFMSPDNGVPLEPFVNEQEMALGQAVPSPLEQAVFDEPMSQGVLGEMPVEFTVPQEQMDPYNIAPQDVYDPQMQEMYDPQMQEMMDPYMMPGPGGPGP